MQALIAVWIAVVALLACAPVQAATYANTSFAYSWIDASNHAKLGYNTTPYRFNGSAGCGTSPPVLDDTLSDALPIGFSFMYSGVAFSTLRVMTNGRVQFNNNVTCGYGSPVQTLPYPNSSLNYTMRIYGNDLDPTSKLEVPTYNTACASRLTCYVSYATIGTAPYRSFVVTWNNVPEWTTGTSTTGSYSLQLILQENGEFIYQYGTAVAGPSAKLGQIGWQADSNDYDTPQTGFPVTNSAIKFYIPRPVLEYRMEQPSWSNTPEQVTDTSGNGRDGTVLGGAQTIAAGRVCRAASFPLNTSAAAIAAVDSGLSVPSTMGGAGTITFWYKANTAWSGSGTRDAQLLDATQINNEWFFLVRRSTGALRFVVTDSLGNVRVVETAANSVPAGTWKHIAVSWSFNALAASNSDRLRIYVDGVLQKESAFTTAAVVSPRIGSLFIGDNRSAVTGQSGSGNSTDGAIDELRAYNYEGGLALVQRDQNLSQAGCLSHYAVTNTGSGLTCQQSTLTVTAHDVNHNNIVMPNNTTQILLTTSNGIGDWALIAGYGVLSNGTLNDGVATYLFNGEYQAVFGLSSGTAATVSVNVTDGQFTEQEDQSLVIKACAVARFNACEATSSRCVPSTSSLTYARLNTKLADTAFKLDLVKLKTDASLETSFNGKATVDLLVNTATGVALGVNNCPLTQTAVIPLGLVGFTGGYSSANVSIPATALSAVAPRYSAYRDVRVRVTCTTAECSSANVGCSTDSFAVRPQQFTLSSNMSNSALSGTPSLAAGAQFTLGATAVAGYNGTPLVDNSAVGQKITGFLSVTDYTDRLASTSNASPFPLGQAVLASGLASNSGVTYGDVGTFRMLPEAVLDNAYTSVDQPGDCVIGSSNNTAVNGKFGCNIANQAQSPEPVFGRFFPDHYALTGALTAACGDFTYLGQRELGVVLGATALSKGKQILARYGSAYPGRASVSVGAGNAGAALSIGRLTPALPAFAWNQGRSGRSYTTDGGAYAAGSTQVVVAGSGGLSAGELIKFAGDATIYTVQAGTAGAGSLTLAAPGLQQAIPSGATGITVLHSFDRLASGQDGPYDDFSLVVGISDSDGALISSVNGLAVAPAASVAIGDTRLRHGRLRINNMYGSEQRALLVPLVAQYWNGSAYAANTLDNCTALLRKNFGLKDYLNLTDVQLPAASSLPLDSGLLQQGGGSVLMAKPAAPVKKKGTLTLQSLMPYLPGQARETIGALKSEPVFFMRELY
ncbi:concanavalin A-like lectin/glucanase superfamily protein [Janthinobacterium sp. 35]|uniref:LamG domain-containing protein n=1 Tax=Janthinobacterium sp. 35 TaxID=2035210 RepID=UPI000C17F672|nr:LamG domain-containing protein [Janthinobacterium sp. 35]PIG30203.1 concanavalin A-like lectin/glucanase superfamily protein [Janthinobacterium sp. 35]